MNSNAFTDLNEWRTAALIACAVDDSMPESQRDACVEQLLRRMQHRQMLAATYKEGFEAGKVAA